MEDCAGTEGNGTDDGGGADGGTEAGFVSWNVCPEKPTPSDAYR